MPATAYHVMYQTFPQENSIEASQCTLVSEFYFEQEEAIERIRELLMDDSLDQRFIPQASEVERQIALQGMFGRGREGRAGNPDKSWRIKQITIQ